MAEVKDTSKVVVTKKEEAPKEVPKKEIGRQATLVECLAQERKANELERKK